MFVFVNNAYMSPCVHMHVCVKSLTQRLDQWYHVSMRWRSCPMSNGGIYFSCSCLCSSFFLHLPSFGHGAQEKDRAESGSYCAGCQGLERRVPLRSANSHRHHQGPSNVQRGAHQGPQRPELFWIHAGMVCLPWQFTMSHIWRCALHGLRIIYFN